MGQDKDPDPGRKVQVEPAAGQLGLSSTTNPETKVRAAFRQGRGQNVALHLTCTVIVGGCISLSSASSEPGFAIANYARAVGGSASDTVRTRITRGIVDLGPPGVSGGFTLTEATPDRRLFVVQLPNGLESREGFDGQAGWVRGPQGQVREEPAAITESPRRERLLSRDPRLGLTYHSFAGITGGASGTGTIHLTIATATCMDGATDTLTFDLTTGLLARRRTTMQTPQGTVAVQVEFDDYRRIGALAVPFHIVQRRADRVVSLRVQSVEFNTEVASNTFQKPH